VDGDEKFVTIEGIKLRDLVHKTGNVIQRLQKFPIYLQESSNTLIGTIMVSAFKSLAPAALVTLFWVRELQRIEVALQNKLNQDQDALHESLLRAMQTKLIDCTSYVKARRSLSIFTNLWEKTFRKLSLEFSLHNFFR
jgi:hypothetical protein